MISLEAIDSAKHIVILTSSDSFAEASALYTHILRMHKKVSIVCESGDVDNALSFLPWFDKLRNIIPGSADFTVNMDLETESLYELFKSNEITINAKMATALYAGLLKRFDGFINSDVDGTIFATVSELIKHGADYRLCNKSIMNMVSLSTLRLKAIMLKNMILTDASKTAQFVISDDDLQSSGADISEAYEIIKEGLNLPYVERTILINSDNEILKSKMKEI
ncbi:MAG: phosphoesterase [Campylobacterota bacterium]